MAEHTVAGKAREGGVCTVSTQKHVQVIWCCMETTGLSAWQISPKTGLKAQGSGNSSQVGAGL